MSNRKLVAVILSLITVSFTLALLLLPKEDFSAEENRYLTKLPPFTAASFLNGEYATKLNTYAADHFPWRNELIEMKTATDYLLGKSYLNGTYLLNDTLVKDYHQPKHSALLVKTLNDFALNNPQLALKIMLIPSAYTYAPIADKANSELESLEYLSKHLNIPNIALDETFKEASNDYPLFYRLDHHWTSYAAFLAYQKWCEVQGFPRPSLTDFKISAVSRDFRGTLFSKFPLFTLKADTIYRFDFKAGLDVTLSFPYAQDKRPEHCLYFADYLQKKDKYAYFLGGNYDCLLLTNKKAISKRKLLVIKDSYANALLPFLIHDYAEIHVLDPRFFNQSISAYCRENKLSEGLLIYNLNTLDEDYGIYRIK